MIQPYSYSDLIYYNKDLKCKSIDASQFGEDSGKCFIVNFIDVIRKDYLQKVPKKYSNIAINYYLIHDANEEFNRQYQALPNNVARPTQADLEEVANYYREIPKFSKEQNNDFITFGQLYFPVVLSVIGSNVFLLPKYSGSVSSNVVQIKTSNPCPTTSMCTSRGKESPYHDITSNMSGLIGDLSAVIGVSVLIGYCTTYALIRRSLKHVPYEKLGAQLASSLKIL